MDGRLMNERALLITFVLCTPGKKCRGINKVTFIVGSDSLFICSFKVELVGPCSAVSVGHLTRKSEVLGSIPGLATYFRFSFPDSRRVQLSVTGESMCTKYLLTAQEV